MSSFVDFTEAMQEGRPMTIQDIGKVWLNKDCTYQYFLEVDTERLFVRRFDKYFGRHGKWIEKFTC